MSSDLQPDSNAEFAEGQPPKSGSRSNKPQRSSTSGAKRQEGPSASQPPQTNQGSAAATPKPPASRAKTPATQPPRPRPPQPPVRQKRRAPLPSVDDSDPDVELTRWQQIRRQLPPKRTTASFIVSMVVHILLLVALALIVIAPRQTNGVLSIDSGIDDTSQLTQQLQSTQQVQQQTIESSSSFEVSTKITLPLPESPVVGVQSSRPRADRSPIVSATDLKAFSNLPTGGGMGGRSEESRNELVKSEGGTAASEAAVDMGLAWLAAHQRDNGAWWFDFHDSACRGRCRNPGSVGSSTAATGLALLCFLGRGETTQQGKYQEEVQRGLYYLQNRMVFTKYGGDLQEGSMYGHAIATLALCEAYGMTQDQALRPLAQKAVDFIVHAQHEKGGWRYNPKQPGDTTVTGWQVMALRSAHLAGLEVPSPTIEMTRIYLDSVQTFNGSRYKYLPEYKEETPVPTAVGLLCRMYLGWSRDMTPLREGVRYLVEQGPSTSDLYFDYYATQVIHHYGEPYWDGWNRLMRDYLVNTQERSGHEKGSWHFADEHADQAGRLYSTAMAIMILEVYYRYLPLYGERAVDFPL